MIEAAYYDGRSARRHAVQVAVRAGIVEVTGEGVERRERLERVDISEKLGTAPRKLVFADGAFCEVRDHAALEEALRAAGHREGTVDRMQRRLSFALISLAGVVAVLASAYVWGLPLLAAEAARAMPEEATRYLSVQSLELLDRSWLEPSKLPTERKLALGRAFAQLQPPAAGGGRFQLRFRASPAIGANAFALPDGTIVLLDELVGLAASDEEILAVLAHELGHVHHRHGLRMLVQGTLVGALAAWWIGDTSTLLAAIPAALAQAQYSREFESESDAYAANMLRANGIDPARLADLLEKLMKAHHVEQAAEGARWADYLQSHPAPAERIRALRGERLQEEKPSTDEHR